MSKHSIHFSPEVADGVTTSHFKRVKKIEGEVHELRNHRSPLPLACALLLRRRLITICSPDRFHRSASTGLRGRSRSARRVAPRRQGAPAHAARPLNANMAREAHIPRGWHANMQVCRGERFWKRPYREGIAIAHSRVEWLRRPHDSRSESVSMGPGMKGYLKKHHRWAQNGNVINYSSLLHDAAYA